MDLGAVDAATTLAMDSHWKRTAPFQSCPLDFDSSAGAFKQSPQCETKNCFSVGKMVSALPMMGRSAVVICTATSRKMMTQVWKPACEWAWEWENPVSKNRRPKMVAMNQK